MLQLVLLNTLDRKSYLQIRTYFFFSSFSLFFLLYCVGLDFWTYETVIATKEIFRGSPRTWPDVAPASLETPFAYSWTILWCCLWARPCAVYLRSQGSYVGYFHFLTLCSLVFLCLVVFPGLSHREPSVLCSPFWRDGAQHSSHHTTVLRPSIHVLPSNSLLGCKASWTSSSRGHHVPCSRLHGLLDWRTGSKDQILSFNT